MPPDARVSDLSRGGGSRTQMSGGKLGCGDADPSGEIRLGQVIFRMSF